MLNLAESLAQPILSQSAQRVNDVCLNLTSNEVRMKGVQLDLLEREIAELAADVMDRADTQQVRIVYRDGLSGIINHFHGNTGAQQAVRVFEERAVLNMILSEVLARDEGDVQVFIAGDGRWEELNHLTMILSRYGIPGQTSGALGVVGPTHLNYGRAISTVRYMSNLMTNMLVKLFGEPTNGDDPQLPA
jgi:heat-inducible transcriptional repressor